MSYSAIWRSDVFIVGVGLGLLCIQDTVLYTHTDRSQMKSCAKIYSCITRKARRTRRFLLLELEPGVNGAEVEATLRQPQPSTNAMTPTFAWITWTMTRPSSPS